VVACFLERAAGPCLNVVRADPRSDLTGEEPDSPGCVRVYDIRDLDLGRLIPAMQDKTRAMFRYGFQHFGPAADDYAIWLRRDFSEFSLNFY